MARKPTIKSLKALTMAEIDLASAIGDRLEALKTKEMNSDLNEARDQGYETLLRSLTRVSHHAETGAYAVTADQGAEPSWEGMEHSPENLQKFASQHRQQTELLTDPARRAEINHRAEDLMTQAHMLGAVHRLKAFAEANGLRLSAAADAPGDGPDHRTARFLPTSTAIGVTWSDGRGSRTSTAGSAPNELTAMYLLALEISGKNLRITVPGRQERELTVPDLM